MTELIGAGKHTVLFLILNTLPRCFLQSAIILYTSSPLKDPSFFQKPPQSDIFTSSKKMRIPIWFSSWQTVIGCDEMDMIACP